MHIHVERIEGFFGRALLYVSSEITRKIVTKCGPEPTLNAEGE